MKAADYCIAAAEQTIKDLISDGTSAVISSYYVRSSMVGGEMIGQLLSERSATHQMRAQCVKFLCKQWGWSRADAFTATYFKGC